MNCTKILLIIISCFNFFSNCIDLNTKIPHEHTVHGKVVYENFGGGVYLIIGKNLLFHLTNWSRFISLIKINEEATIVIKQLEDDDFACNTVGIPVEIISINGHTGSICEDEEIYFSTKISDIKINCIIQ